VSNLTFERHNVTLDNWRTAPFSSWAFQHVSEIVPSAVIASKRIAESPSNDLGPFGNLPVKGISGETLNLPGFLAQTNTDSFLIMRRSELTAEWHAPHCDPAKPHLIFSVSKSVTGLLAGILIEKCVIADSDLVIRYIPEAARSGFADATLRNLLDMEISLDFEENYLAVSGDYPRYRRSTLWNPTDPAHAQEDLKTVLCELKRGPIPHGTVHAYQSPCPDLLGIVLERASECRFADLVSELIWQPMGAHSDAMVTVDSIGTPRAAGGISVTARDLARLGDVVRLGGKNIVPSKWIADLWNGGSREAWRVGDQAAKFPKGSYRSYWYETGEGELCAIGIHGQWIWIYPASETVIIKLSSQPLPTDDQTDTAIIKMLRAVSKA
jgi:CubicO group peptidase (beta-lactamase class C family)